MKKAWIFAGIKAFIGLVVLLSVIGIRILTTGGGDVESEVAELDRFESERDETVEAADPSFEPEPSKTAVAGVFERARASLSQDSREADPNRMVACSLAGGRQFMSGGDCALRGGRATDI